MLDKSRRHDWKWRHYTVNGTWEKNNILYTEWFTFREIFHLPHYRSSCRRRSSKGGSNINISFPHVCPSNHLEYCTVNSKPPFSLGFHGDCVYTCIMQNINWQWHPPSFFCLPQCCRGELLKCTTQKISVRHSRFSSGPSWGCWGILQNGHRL